MYENLTKFKIKKNRKENKKQKKKERITIL